MKSEIAYAAGLFDGEGNIGTKWPSRFQAYLRLKMVHKPTVEKFARITGGKVTKGYEHRRGRKTQWECLFYDKEAVRVAKMLFPYLCEKRDQAGALIAFKMAGTKDIRNQLNDLIKSCKRCEYHE